MPRPCKSQIAIEATPYAIVSADVLTAHFYAMKVDTQVDPMITVEVS